jgi:hypothetical protein
MAWSLLPEELSSPTYSGSPSGRCLPKAVFTAVNRSLQIL